MKPDYSWQDEAVRAWFDAGCQGIVEAITGTGKTFMGLKAIQERMARSLAEGSRTYPVVVVPTIVLQRQWERRLREHFGDMVGRIGLLGNGRRDGFHTHGAIVAVVNSLATHGPGLLAFLTRSPGSSALLVADECHRYIDAAVFRKILDLPFHYRLGLTPRMATGEGIDHHVKGLGSIVKELAMPEARQRGLVPPFHLLNIPVPLTGDEASKYDKLTVAITRLKEDLERTLPEDALDTRGYIDWDAVQDLVKTLPVDDALRRRIVAFFTTCYRRAELYYLAENKLAVLREAIRILGPYGGKVLVFFERIVSADTANDLLVLDQEAQLLDALAVDRVAFPWCRVFHSGLSAGDREQLLKEFGSPGNKILIACRCLDEGFDLPEVDVAILAASSKSPRQRIQRIGRVLRRCDDEKRSFILTLYALGTGDQAVVANDHEMFPDPTDVYPCTGSNWAKTFSALLAYYAKRTKTPRIDAPARPSPL